VFVGKFFRAAGLVIEPLLSWILGPRDFRSMGMGLLGATVPLALIGIWYTGFGRLWGWWDDLAVRQVFDARSIAARKGDSPVTAFLVVTAGFFPLELAMLLIVRPKWLEPAKLEQEALLVVGTALVGWVAIGFVVTIVSAAISLYRSRPAERKQNAGVLLAIIGGAIAVCLFVLSSEKLPVLQTVKDRAGALVGLAASLAFLGQWHRNLLQTAALKGHRHLLWWVALLLPLAPCGLLIYALTTLPDRGGASDDVMFGFIGVYGFGLGLSWAIIML
jgi:hypothetical protein